ncbi:MAG: plasmid recombination protein [Rubrivivax sp.]|jgi:hypothetical protein
MASQFARAHAYGGKQIDAVLGEADRQPELATHVTDPKPPAWLLGSAAAVRQAVDGHMAEKAPVRLKGGGIAWRKRRHDHKCLVAGVLSYPLPMSMFKKLQADPATRQKAGEAFVAWRNASVAWLQKQYGAKLAGVVLHIDERNPHIHFFVAGDAQRLHPGMRAELVNDQRLEDPPARMAAHKAGLAAWLTQYHAEVSQRFGIQRGDGTSRPTWRIQDRALRQRVYALEKRLSQVEEQQLARDLQAARDDIWDAAKKGPRPKLRF